MARQPVQEIALNGQIRPVASPVDTFVQPAASPLRDLAASLATLGGPLEGMLKEREDKKKKEEAVLGQAAVYGDHAEELREGVASGKIPPQYSPTFMENFKEADGNLAGGQLITKFSSAFTAWGDKDTATDEQYDQFMADFLKQNIQAKDPYVLKGLLPQIGQLENNARQMWVSHKASTVAKGFMNTSVALGMQDVDKFRSEGNLTDKGTDYGALWSSIATRRASLVGSGVSGDEFDKAIVEGMSAKAMETGDLGLLKFFDQTIPGTDRKYGDSPDFLKIKMATEDNIIASAHKKLVDEAQVGKVERERKKNEATVGIIDFLRTSPGEAEVPEALLKQAEQNGDETIRTKLKQWREDLLPTKKTDPEVVSTLQQQMIQNPANADRIYRSAIEKRVFAGDPEAMRAVGGFKDSLKENADVIDKAITSPTMNRLLDTIGKKGSERNELGDLLTGLSAQAQQAQQDLTDQVVQFVLANPEAKSYEVQKFIAETGAKVLGNFTEDPEASIEGGFKYDRPEEMGAPLVPDQTPPEDGPVDNPNDKAGQQKAETYETQPPETKKMVDDMAKGSGVTPQQMWKTIMESSGTVKPISYTPESDLGEGDSRGRGLTFEKAQAIVDEAIQSAQAGSSTGSIRQLILGAETDGDYNAVFGREPGSVNLANYTLDDILKQQERARSEGMASTAVGGYQFLYKTTRGLKESMGLTGKEKFTPELQDRMADTLLEQRGLSKFQSGQMSKRQFALRLSQEWAALPNPNTGRSFYAGDGLNKSRTHVGNVYEALGVPVSFGGTEYDRPYTGGLRFNNPGQEAGVRPELKSAVADTFKELGLSGATILSGFRGKDHPAERGKGSGGGEHTHGGAMDVSMAGLSEQQRSQLVKGLIGKGVKRFITYSNSPDMLHVDLKDQTGNGSAYFMHNKSAKNLAKAPSWFRNLALGSTDI